MTYTDTWQVHCQATSCCCLTSYALASRYDTVMLNFCTLSVPAGVVLWTPCRCWSKRAFPKNRYNPEEFLTLWSSSMAPCCASFAYFSLASLHFVLPWYFSQCQAGVVPLACNASPPDWRFDITCHQPKAVDMHRHAFPFELDPCQPLRPSKLGSPFQWRSQDDIDEPPCDFDFFAFYKMAPGGWLPQRGTVPSFCPKQSFTAVE